MSFFSSNCNVGSTGCDKDDIETEMATAEMMRHEAMRLMTYTKWPSSSSQDPARLAEAGFFYTGSDDRVKCAFCLGVLKMWKLEDIPLAEHQSHFPYCRFLQGKEVGNIPLSQRNPDEVLETTYQGKGNRHASVPCCEIQGNILPFAHTSSGTSDLPLKPAQDIILPPEALNTLSNTQNQALSEVPSPFEVPSLKFPSPPIVPDFTREVHRLATFSRWPEESTVLPEDLARAGFYHEPQDAKPDRVKCGYCGGKVYGWQAGDDPWMEHARCFPTCPYIRLCLGDEMLQDITAYMLESGRIPLFPCSIAACPETFDTLLGYESHYNSVHRHTCSECRRSYPSNHLLEIHLREAHDPLFSLQSGDKFVCLVQGCEQKFAAPKIRKNHMVKKHKYPANYRFDRAKPGKAAVRQSTAAARQSTAAARQSKAGEDMGDDQHSQTRVNSASNQQSQAAGDSGTGGQNEAGDDMEVTMEKENIPQEGTARRVFTYKVPQNICFGHGSTRSFQRPRGRRKPKHWHQSNMETDTSVHIENVDMGELKDALE